MPDIQVDSIGTRPNYTLAYYNTPATYYSSAYAPDSLSFKGTSNQVVYKNEETYIEQSPKNNRAKIALSVLATAGAAAFCIVAHGKGKAKGVEGFFKRIGEGSREIYNNTLKSIKNKLNFKGTEKLRQQNHLQGQVRRMIRH